ncbi:MAG: tetrahydromethanopterin S-methyltransferase subunit H [Archaeoglobi archaeon]|nr:tetrahydromethanopterin S-methyltransferase subunit H [Candidatus Mnemosynella bozhongmuii]
MLRFENQKVFEISGVKFGGSKGENPTVLIGSIFYGGHRIVEDEKKGIFDKERAEKLIAEMEELSDKTGNPGILDVVGMSGEAMKRYIEFVSDVTEKPFLVDSANTDVRIETLRFIHEIGLEERVIYNSITPETREREIEELRNSKVRSAIVLCYTPNTMSAKARIESFEKILPMLSEAGIEMPLIDTFVMDVPSLPAATKAGIEIKRRGGLPCGSGAHNAVASWRGFKKRFGGEAFKYASLTANVYSLVFGFDFVLYGPIEDSKLIFPAVHLIDTSMRYLKRTGEFLEL